MRQYSLTLTPEAAAEHFGAPPPNFPPRDEIVPGEPIELVVSEPYSRGEARRFMLARWGLLPPFVKEPLPLIVNARAETLLEKPSFAPAFRRRRCLVPASGYRLFPGPRAPKVTAADGAPLALAGLYETYLHPNGSEVDTACVITLAAGADLTGRAERMPAILPRAAFARWLDHETTPLAAAQALLQPPPEGSLRIARGTIR